MEILDNLDKGILYELDVNARIPASRLAKKLRKSKETINFRINRLLEKNYLTGFYTIFNTSKLGYYYIKTYVKFKNLTPKKEKEIFNYIQKQSNISFLARTDGHYDMIVLVMVREPGDLIAFLNPFMKKYGDYIHQKDMTTFITAHRFNQKLFTPELATQRTNYPISMGDYMLDETDKEIMLLLSENARMPLTEIAKKLGIDPKVVKYRINKLEKNQIILRYVSSPNFSKLGLQFIQINISFKDPTAMNSVLEYFDSTNKCLFFMEMIGTFDATIEVHVKDSEELKLIMDGFREKFAGYYTTYDIMAISRQYKMVWNPFR